MTERSQCQHTKDDGSWWEYDGRGIPLCRVCDKCREERLGKYNPAILGHYSESDVDERIEDDY